jgi:uncharacterized membrane protein YkoI
MLAKSLLLSLAALLGVSGGVSALPAAAATPTALAPSAEAGFHSPIQQIEQNLISPREAIDIVRRTLGGEPMGAPGLEQNGGRPCYVMRWRFPNEVVDVVRVDAVTGQVMR